MKITIFETSMLCDVAVKCIISMLIRVFSNIYLITIFPNKNNLRITTYIEKVGEMSGAEGMISVFS